jgi:nicotinate-nucleotide adenylyltransferase
LAARRLGVLGGTFNPIHLGHLQIAQIVRRIFGLDRIYFVVAAAPPHKPQQNLVSLAHRYAMVSLATAGTPFFIPSLIELEAPPSPFSIDTMAKFEQKISDRDARLYFIGGGDSLMEVSTWKESEKLLSSYSFIFVMRPGMGPFDPASVLPAQAAPKVRRLAGLGRHRLQRRVKAEEASGGNLIFTLDIGALDVSASQIRDLVAHGKRIRHLVPAPVHEYLQKTHLYGER